MNKYHDNIEIGDKLDQYKMASISRIQIAQFAAASSDFSPLNLEDQFAKDVGFQGVCVPQNFALAAMERAVSNFASNITLVSLSATFQKLIWPNDSIIANGLIIRRYKKGEEHRVKFSMWCENQRGEIVTKGSSIVVLFKNKEHENQSKVMRPALSEDTRSILMSKANSILKQAKNAATVKTKDPEPA